MMYSNENHINCHFSYYGRRAVEVIRDVFDSCINPQNSLPWSSRRGSCPESSELSSSFSDGRTFRVLRSEEVGHNTVPARHRSLSSENLTTSSELRKEIQRSRRVNRKQLSFVTKSDQGNLHHRTSDASTSEQVPIHVLRETVKAEVHNTQSLREQATDDFLRHRTRSYDSLFRHTTEEARPSSRRDNVRPINYELNASRTPTNPGTPLVNKQYEPYDGFDPPPSPAPTTTNTQNQISQQEQNAIEYSIYSNIAFSRLSGSAEATLPPAPRSILRKSQYNTDNEIGNSLERPICRELPRIYPTDSPKRRRLSHGEPSHDSPQRCKSSHIDHPVHGSHSEPAAEFGPRVRRDHQETQIGDQDSQRSSLLHIHQPVRKSHSEPPAEYEPRVRRDHQETQIRVQDPRRSRSSHIGQPVRRSHSEPPAEYEPHVRWNHQETQIRDQDPPRSRSSHTNQPVRTSHSEPPAEYEPHVRWKHQETQLRDQDPQRSRSSYIDQPIGRLHSEPSVEYEPHVRTHQETQISDQIDSCEVQSLPIHRRRPNLSAQNYLELSPDFNEDFTITIHQEPQGHLRRPVEERFLERYPHQVQVERPNLSTTSRQIRSSRSLRREPESPQSFYGNHNRDFVIMMNSLDEHDRKIIIEFCHLLEKSKQLFNGLRELPHYGHKQWHAYFGRTFDVYTKLWKFQQQHRVILDSKYGLKRWQIGEIASKIGQLYYHFYLRTSETAYLNEAHSFYSAIRGRSYYTQASREDKCELMVKKLRYYARYIVVSLLLNKIKLVMDLLKELTKQIIDYGATYSPDDQLEWTVVADEVRAFIKALSVVSVFHTDSFPVVLSHRMNPQTTPPVDRNHFMNLVLQEVLVVGSNLTQVKFSELTMDMFRIIQTLEREPSGDIQHMYDESPRQRYPSTPSAANSKGYNLECAPNRAENPHKYLLCKPSPNQIFVYLASACSDLPPNGALLLYLSADGMLVQPPKHPSEDAAGYESGGLITTSKVEVAHKETTKDGKAVQTKHKDHQVLHPGDLYPFTRRPMFLIVDSDNSYIFQNMPQFFGQPLVILMSPIEEPASLHASVTDKRQNGSLFTLFLHCPLSALCYCCDITNMSLENWERSQSYINNFLAEASQIFTRNRTDMTFMAFMGDDFFRLLILRFIFCEAVLRLHRAFRSRNHLTRSLPSLPDDLFEHPVLTRIVMDLASQLQVRGHFHDPSAPQ